MFTPLKDLPTGKNWTLEELNDREVQLLIPVIIFISIAMVVGTVGNAFVLYVNISIFKLGNSTYRYFITFLALADIAFCMIGDPFVIVVLIRPYTFTNTLACKGFRAFTYFNGTVSVLVLFVIAVDRYRRICRPHGSQFSIRWIKIIFGIIAFLSFIVSVPSFILYGENTVQTGIANITGIQCFPDDMYKDTWFPNAYNTFLYVCFISIAALMSAFYIMVWRQVAKHKHSMGTAAYVTEPKVSSGTKETKDIYVVSATTIAHTQHNILDDPEKVDVSGKYINKGKKENTNKKSTDTQKDIHVSKILFVVTAFFVLSFAPFLTLEVLTFFGKQFVENLDNTNTMFYQLFWNTFAMNFMVNPFIYGVMDKKFRMECKKIALKRLSLSLYIYNSLG